MPRYTDIKGKRFGRLVAINYVKSNKNGSAFWRCACDCGKETIVLYSAMKSGNTISCGCALTEALTSHGKSNSKLYQVWQSMKTRCDNPKSNRFAYYGGKGVKYHENWSAFENFYADMHEGYKDGLTLDRIDGSKDYSKENCHWVDYTSQNNNKSDNIILKYRGEKFTVREASEKFSIPLCTIYNRKRRGWSDKRIIEMPIVTKCRNYRRNHKKEKIA